eukprot:1137009-Pelagomonas_calceolata.AAC.1
MLAPISCHSPHTPGALRQIPVSKSVECASSLKLQSLEVISGREFILRSWQAWACARTASRTVRDGSQNRKLQKAYDLRITAVFSPAKTVQHVVRSVGKQHENW